MVAASVDETGAVLAAVPVLAQDLDSVAWLGSVAGLSNLPTGVGQHLRSWFPGSAFVARSSGDPVVLAVTDPAAATMITARPGRIGFSARGGRGDETWLGSALLPALNLTSALAVTGTSASADWWGTDRLVEFVGCSTDPVGVAAAALPARGRACAWCGELVAAPSCPVCGMRVSAGSALAGTSGPAAGPSAAGQSIPSWSVQ
jgi:hypothetical protein